MDETTRPSPVDALTSREYEILRLLTNGLTDSEIAEAAILTVGTVKWYNRQIYSKLGVRNRVEAITRTQHLSLLRSPPQPTAPVPVLKPVHNLPQYTTSFVGRQQELAEITRLLHDSHCRLLSLIGPGGSGKTRLALEVANQIKFDDGVYFVPLQPLQSTDQVLGTIISVLQLRLDQTIHPKQVLLNYLSRVNLLLILDNFEHVLDAADLIVDMLSATSRVKLLVTSREPLKVQGEWVREVNGLSYPSTGARSMPSDYSAIQLFAERAQQVKANFSLDDDFEPVAYIAQMVAGLPLALELAAGWLRTLSCSAIVTELGQSADILTSNTRNIPERHRSMRTVFDHSWRQLSDNECAALQRLAVFRGGCTREAAQQVAGASLPVLVALVEKSLVRYNPETDRYDMQELLRQYAEERLKDSPADQLETQNRHSAYYADFLGNQETAIKGRLLYQTILEIAKEIDNVRSAWQWSLRRGICEEVEKYLWCLLSFYWHQGRLQEGEMTFESGIQYFEECKTDSEKRILALLFSYRAYCLMGLGYFERARDIACDSATILRRLRGQQELAFALMLVGGNDRHLGAYDEAANIFDEVEVIYRDLGDDFSLGSLLYNRASLSREIGKIDEAEQLLEKSIELYKPSGYPCDLTIIFSELGQLMEARGNYRGAKQAYQESLEAMRQFPISMDYGYALLRLGKLSHKLNENEEALRYFQEALHIAKEGGVSRLQLDIMPGMAEIYIVKGDKERAVELLTLSLQHPASCFETKDRAQQLLDELRLALPAEVFESARERGKITTIDQTIEALYKTSLFSPV